MLNCWAKRTSGTSARVAGNRFWSARVAQLQAERELAGQRVGIEMVAREKQRDKGQHRDDQGEFAWGGCSTNVRYGSNFARQFIDARERKLRDSKALMNLHNNRIGRKVSIRTAFNATC